MTFNPNRWILSESEEMNTHLLNQPGIPDGLKSVPLSDLSVMGQMLDFFDDPNVVVVQFIPRDGKAQEFLIKWETVVELTGDPQTVLAGNQRMGLTLNEGNILSYYRYFWTMTHGPDYPRIVESSDDFTDTTSELLSVLKPAVFVEMLDDAFVCESLMMHQDNLALMRFAVSQHGAMQLLSQAIIGVFGRSGTLQ